MWQFIIYKGSAGALQKVLMKYSYDLIFLYHVEIKNILKNPYIIKRYIILRLFVHAYFYGHLRKVCYKSIQRNLLYLQ